MSSVPKQDHPESEGAMSADAAFQAVPEQGGIAGFEGRLKR